MEGAAVVSATSATVTELGLSIVMPAYNEAANLDRAIDGSLAAAASTGFVDVEVIVVNDGSTDATGQLLAERAASDPRVRSLGWRRNRGYGAAVSTGLRAASKGLVLFTDADNQFDLGELRLLLPHLERPEVGVVCGYRRVRRDPTVRKLNAAGWNALVRLLFYVPVRDIDCAFKLFRREVLTDLDISSMGAMVNTELMVKLGRNGVGVVEVGVSHFPRTAGVARGANLRVISRALYELAIMRNRLSGTDATSVRAGGVGT
jgi:glycosyltransferase involved in cell wall biosynthesis